MILLRSDQIDPSSWTSLVRESPTATWFQTREAFSFFDSLSFLEAFVVAVETDDALRGLIVGYIQKDGGRLKQYCSRRAIILGGPLLAANISDRELEALLTTARRHLQKRVIYIESRNFNDYSRWKSTFGRCGFRYNPHYNVLVDTSTLDTVDNHLDRNRRRNIKKAVTNGIVIDDNPGVDDVHAFHHILSELYFSKVKTPPLPLEFFEKLSTLPSSSFFLAKSPEGEVIGGLVCVALGGKALYAWAACGDDKNHKALSPSVMSNYAGLCKAAKSGIPLFDFMGAGSPGDGGYGVRDFKLKFGGRLVEYGRYICVCKPLLFFLGKTAVKIIKRI